MGGDADGTWIDNDYLGTATGLAHGASVSLRL
jgi:hypothetical protein